MQKKIVLTLALLSLLLPSTLSLAYTGNSLRIQALGEGLAGIIEDEYTDIYRNPAYLALVTHPQLIVDFGRYQPELRVVAFPPGDPRPIVYPDLEPSIFVQTDSIRHHLPGPALSYSPSPKTPPSWRNKKRGGFLGSSDHDPWAPNFLLGLVANPFPFFFQSGMGAVILDANYYKNTSESGDIVRHYDAQGEINSDREHHDLRGSYRKNTEFKLVYSFRPTLNSQMGLDFSSNFSQDENNYTHYSVESYYSSGSLYESDNKGKNLDQSHLYMGRLGFTQLLSSSSQLDLVWKAFSASGKNERSYKSENHKFLPHSSTEVTTKDVQGPSPENVWGWGLEANLKKELSSSSTIHYIFGFAYRNEDRDSPQEEYYHYLYTIDESTSYAQENIRRTDLTRHSNEEIYQVSFGLGMELRPKENLKIGVGLRGNVYRRSERENVTGQDFYTYINTADSLSTENVYDLTWKIDTTVKQLTFLIPLGMEIMANRGLAIRFGVAPYGFYYRSEGKKIIETKPVKNRDENSHLEVHYTFGLGYKIGQRASFDLYTQGDFTSVNNWQAAATVKF